MDIQVIASGSTGNSYRISDSVCHILLDAGLPIARLQRELNYRVSALSACLLSHAHQDHSKGVPGLARLGIDIYTSAGTIAECGLAGHRVHAVKPLEEFTVGTWKVLPFDVQHDSPEPLGFLIASTQTGEKLLYFTDTFYVKYRFDGLTHIMAECNYDQESLQRAIKAGYVPVELLPRIMKSHMSLEHLIEMLKANDLSSIRQIYLMHLSRNNSNAVRFKYEVQKATGAEVYIC